MKFSDDEGDEEGEEEQTESSNDSRYENTLSQNLIQLYIYRQNGFKHTCVLPLDFSEQQKSQDVPPAGSRSRASDSSEDNHHTPSSNSDKDPQPPSSKPGWAEEGGSGRQGGPPNYQVENLNCSHKVSGKACSNGEKKESNIFEGKTQDMLLYGRQVTCCVGHLYYGLLCLPVYRGAGLDWVVFGSSPPPHLGRSLDKGLTPFIAR